MEATSTDVVRCLLLFGSFPDFGNYRMFLNRYLLYLDLYSLRLVGWYDVWAGLPPPLPIACWLAGVVFALSFGFVCFSLTGDSSPGWGD